MDWINDPQAWIALLTLTALELVLGIDNIVFLSILVGRLHGHQQRRARQLGLLLAMLMRIVLLLSLSWIMRLTAPLFTVLKTEISGRDLILVVGGLFLLGKSTHEIHHKLEGEREANAMTVKAAFWGVLAQIVVIDMVFSLDSVITAVGMVEEIAIMIIAVVLAVLFMMLFARAVGEFVDRHPTIKMLALSFLLLVGVALVADGLDHHIPRGYLYFAMAFSIFVEMLNLRVIKTHLSPRDESRAST